MDLSTEVSDKAPELKQKVWLSLVFVTFWLGVTLILLLWSLTGRFLLLPIFLVLFIMGVASLKLNLFVLRFFSGFSERHHAIRTARERDMFEPVPPGSDHLGRFMNYLKKNHISYSKFFFRGKPVQGLGYPFDLAQAEPEEGFLSSFLSGSQQKALFVKQLPMLTVTELQAMERDIWQVCNVKGFFPELVVLVQNPEAMISDDLYHYLTQVTHSVNIRGRPFSFPVQMVREIEGSYDFIPYIVRGQ